MIVNNSCRFGQLCIFFNLICPSITWQNWLLAIFDQCTTLFNSRQLTNFDWFFFDTRMSWSISFLKKCIKSYYASFGAKRSFLKACFDHPFEKETDAMAAYFPILKSSCQHQKNKVHAAPCKTFVCLLILTTTTTGGKYVKVKCLTMPLTVPNSPYNYFCQQSLYPSQKKHKLKVKKRLGLFWESVWK